MVFTSVTDRLGNAAGSAVGAVSGRFSDRVIRLGVTGLSRAGKTVFITSLVANLLNRERMPQLLAASEGRIQASFLQPQPDDTLARFDYEANLDSLLRPAPQWPSRHAHHQPIAPVVQAGAAGTVRAHGAAQNGSFGYCGLPWRMAA